MDVNHLSQGTYIVVLKSENGNKTQTKKFIKL
ncbi:MAG: T9SS type A sorting domain-containing protein [Bacteroidetes bacterium]|nr:T9SS type A sorting domain-containing protein [Bacteroidota bacterium]